MATAAPKAPIEQTITLAEMQAQQPLTTATSGKIAIVWNPDKDSEALPAPGGATNDRPFIYDVPDRAALERLRNRRLDIMESDPVRAMALQIEMPTGFRTVRLSPGLNWSDSDLWDAAVADSTANAPNMYRPVDVIQRLINDGAIDVLRRNGGAITGTIGDYPGDAQIRIIGMLEQADLVKLGEVPHPASITTAIMERLKLLAGIM